MLDQIRNSPAFRATHLVLLASAACLLASCATKKEEPLISDRTSGQESQLPWNQQQEWERQGQLGPMAERLNTR